MNGANRLILREKQACGDNAVYGGGNVDNAGAARRPPPKERAASAAYAVIQSLKTAFLMQGAVCKFEPSCSNYAREAVKTLPIHIALVKIVWRVLRCNPFSKGGFDPVS